MSLFTASKFPQLFLESPAGTVSSVEVPMTVTDLIKITCHILFQLSSKLISEQSMVKLSVVLVRNFQVGQEQS